MKVGTALDEALWIYSRIQNYSQQQKYDAAVSLGEWRLFSLRQLKEITGLSLGTLARLVGDKGDRTGGRLSVKSLTHLADLRKQYEAERHLEPETVIAALESGHGTSTYMAARLSGVPRTKIMRCYAKAKEE